MVGRDGDFELTSDIGTFDYRKELKELEDAYTYLWWTLRPCCCSADDGGIQNVLPAG